MKARTRKLQTALLRHATHETLISSLNGDASLPPETSERLADLVALIHRAESLSDESESHECDEVIAKINNELRRHRWSPMLERLDGMGGLKVSRFDNSRTLEEAYEIWCVEWITELVRLRSISRVRRCGECGRWFWAVKDHQKYCSGNCRQAHATHSPVFKEKRAKYMKDFYRPREKELEQKAKTFDRRRTK
jgi:hypothetical protein